jgi:hypothetical protein
MIGEIVRCERCGAPNDFDTELCGVCHHPVDEPEGCDCSRMAVAMHPAVRFRFADVLAELHAIAGLAGSGRAIEPSVLETACRRAESLLLLLRRQFLEDVVFSDRAPSAMLPA